MIGRRFSHYRVVERIGAGGMGEVYRARDEHLPRDVAIKILPAGTLADDQARKRFRKEAETLSQLNHPHIATIYDFDTQDDVDFLVMEFVEGTTLAEKLLDGTLPVDEVLRIGSEIAEALDEAQHRGIVHRDLKPKNIGLTLKGQVKVLDFGLARVLKPSTDTATTETLTGSKGLAGTLPYMAPEQLRGVPADHRSDLYALGVCLYEMATAKRPFENELATALADDILHRAPVSPRRRNPRISRALEHLIFKCLEKSPARRYRSAHELLAAIHHVGSAPLGLDWLRIILGRGRRRSVVLAGAVLLILAGLLAFNAGGWRDRFFQSSNLLAIESVVALPSKVMASEEDAFLTDAIPNTISTYLTQVEGLETKMPPSSIEVERIGGDQSKLAKAYGVEAFVTSTVTARDDRLALNVQLVDAGTRQLLWSKEFDGTRQNFLELVRSAAEGVREAVRPGAKPVLAALTGSEAEILFQRGMYHSNLYNHLHDPSHFDRALTAFNKVLEIEPRAAAAAEIGNLYLFQFEAGRIPVEELLPKLEFWAQRAQQIDPNDARGLDLLAVCHMDRGDGRAALLASLRAVSSAPRDAFVLQGLSTSLIMGSLRLAIEVSRIASAVDPLYSYPMVNNAIRLGLLGHAPDGLAMIDRVLEFEPDMVTAVRFKAILLILMDRTQEVLSYLERMRPMVADGRVDPEAYAQVHDLLIAATGAPKEWRSAIDRQLSWEKGAWYDARELLALVLARRGENDAVLEVLMHRSSIYDWLMLCPDLESPRTDARFQPIAVRARPGFELMLATLNEARQRGEFPVQLEKPLADLLADLGMPDHR